MANKIECIDESVGVLLHGYELGILEESACLSFEAHILQCDYCFSELDRLSGIVTEFKNRETMDSIRDTVEKSPPVQSDLPKKIWRLLWPKLPVLLRPATLLTFIILLIYPVWNGLKPPADNKIKHVETINLVPVRSSSGIKSLSKSESLVITFVYQDAIPGKAYVMRLINEGNDNVFYYDSFRNFDKFGSASLMIPASVLSSGHYELKITDPEVTGQIGQQTYYFGLTIE